MSEQREVWILNDDMGHHETILTGRDGIWHSKVYHGGYLTREVILGPISKDIAVEDLIELGYQKGYAKLES
jgi:hypothetical protein